MSTLDLEKEGVNIINDYVRTWTAKYLFQTTFQNENNGAYTFMTEFSLPQTSKPIPSATVKVYFFLREDEKEKPSGISITFRFESDSLLHRQGKTVRITQMEKWLEKILDKKQRTSKILFLGTEFESTRIKHDELDKIFAEWNYKENKIEDNILSKDLLDHEHELEGEDELVNEDDQIEVLKKTLFQIFRSVDEEDLGVVSFNECAEIFKLMGLEVDKEQWDELMLTADQNRNGIIEYAELLHLGAEIIHGIFMKNQALKKLREREEEYLLQSVLILQNDELHTVVKELIKRCQQIDEEDDLKWISYENLEKLFKEFEDQLLNESERIELLKMIMKDYPDKEIPYDKLYDILLNFRVQLLKNGLMESQLNKLEIYIRSLCQKYDKDNTGLVSLEDFMRELKSCEKIILTKTQVFKNKNLEKERDIKYFESFIGKDEKNMVPYITESRVLASIIKKFFTPILIRKKARFISEGLIQPDRLMEGWTKGELQAEQSALFDEFTAETKGRLELKGMKKMMRKANFKCSDEEIQQYFEQFARDGSIDKESFINHFYIILKHLRCHNAIQQLQLI